MLRYFFTFLFLLFPALIQAQQKGIAIEAVPSATLLFADWSAFRGQIGDGNSRYPQTLYGQAEC
jgi:hypothetical protein